MKIIPLAEAVQYTDVVVTWIYEEFIDPGKFTLEQLRGRFSSMRSDRLPLCLIALDGEMCVGTVSLFKSDLSVRMDLTPWLAALYVPGARRREGIGRLLVSACLQRAGELGYCEVFLRTEFAAGYYHSLGWEKVSDESTEEGVPTTVYKIGLQ